MTVEQRKVAIAECRRFALDAQTCLYSAEESMVFGDFKTAEMLLHKVSVIAEHARRRAEELNR